MNISDIVSSMASVHERKHKGSRCSKFWMMAYRDSRGKQRLRSTKIEIGIGPDWEKSKQRALDFARTIEQGDRMAASPESLTERQARTLLDEILQRTGTGRTLRRIPSVREFSATWLADAVHEASGRSVAQYAVVIRELLASLGDVADRRIDDVAVNDLAAFRDARSKSGLSPSSLRADRRVVSMLFRQAMFLGHIRTNPTSLLKVSKAPPVKRLPFSVAEVQRIIAVAPPEWRTLIMLGYHTGQRQADLAGLRWSSVNLKSRTLSLIQQKTDRAIVVPLTDELWAHLAGLKRIGEYVLPGLCDMDAGGPRGLSMTFGRLMDAAGVDRMPAPGKGKRQLSQRSFHSLRHTFISMLADANVPQEQRMLAAGHQDAKVHDEYSKIAVETLRPALNLLPSLNATTTTP